MTVKYQGSYTTIGINSKSNKNSKSLLRIYFKIEGNKKATEDTKKRIESLEEYLTNKERVVFNMKKKEFFGPSEVYSNFNKKIIVDRINGCGFKLEVSCKGIVPLEEIFNLESLRNYLENGKYK